MRVLLVNPNLSTVMNPKIFPPFAMMILAANVRPKHEVKILDRNIENKKDDTKLEKIILDFKPDIVGVTSLTGVGILDCLGVAKVAKKHGARVVWGGTHASFFPKQTLENQYVDFVVIGEGEITFRELLEALAERKSMRKIEGLGFKEKDKVQINPQREFIKNLDNFPMPAWDLIEVERYIYSFPGIKRKIDMVTSRGCPHRCTFCYNQKFNKRQWRGRSAEKIIEEVKYLKDHYDIDGVRFDDDLFTADKERLKKFNRLNQKTTKIKWDANCRINDMVNEDFLKEIKKGGCVRLTVGVESGCERMLKFLKKDITLDQIYQAFKLASQYHIMTAPSIMVGLPTETKEEVKATLAMAKKIEASHVSIGIYVPYPGAELSDYCQKNKLIRYPKKIEDWSNFGHIKLSSKTFSFQEIKKIVIDFRFRDFFLSVKRGEWSLVNNFFNLRGLMYLKELIVEYF